MSTAAQEFLQQAEIKASDLEHRALIQRGMASYESAFDKGRARFADWEAARARLSQIKEEALASLGQNLVEFEKRIVERGGQVHWAETAEQANDYVVELARARGVKTVVKSKSMVTEEIHLAPALEKAGVTVWETDLGEFIVQLRQERPYHIVTPAMHLSRYQIAELFREKLGENVEDADPAKLVAAARVALRKAFFSAEMGISGANFLVADTGMVALSTNEGNGRLTTSIPPIHVVVTGIEKVIPRLSDLAVFWPMLATSGTGQPITTYSTLVRGPRTKKENDGPREFHVVLVDNGRTGLLGNAETQEVLKCIRCGACLNICPIFRHVGGHTYGAIYPGPIGSIFTPRTAGLREWGHLSYACSLCNACKGVCPVKIDLPKQLLLARRDFVATANVKPAERAGFAGFRWATASARRFRWIGWLGGKVASTVRSIGLSGTSFDPTRAWTKYRAPIEFPRQTFRAWWRSNGKR
ncbi:MAG TPA: lactate utilization protein B [Candidatus Binatia bacterium]|nr:lactate utilization protein B [Candidatus Binatia bacterium]